MNTYTERNSNYIKSKVNALSIYNTYWCLVELRSRFTIQQVDILKNDPLCKLELIKTLKEKKYNANDLDKLLEISGNNSIPLSYVKWFYEDNRAAIWLNMVLKSRNILVDNIYKESDISIFIHNLIFNKKILVTAKDIREGTEGYNETLVYNKRIVLDLLETAYIRSKVPSKEMKWLNKHNTAQVTHMYDYMQKIYDIDNINLNKVIKKLSSQSYNNADKSGCRQALICADSINFRESDTTSRYNHMLASLDYWMFDTYWFDREGIAVDKVKAANRVTFIENMNAAWNSKTRRVSDKKSKDKGLDLTSTNKKLLKLIAKKQGKTQTQMLNDIIASYCPESSYEVMKKSKNLNKSPSGSYAIPYNDSFETAQSIKEKDSSSDPVLVDSYGDSDKMLYSERKVLGPCSDVESVAAQTAIGIQNILPKGNSSHKKQDAEKEEVINDVQNNWPIVAPSSKNDGTDAKADAKMSALDIAAAHNTAFIARKQGHN